MSDPYVSVLMPVYNERRFIRQSVQSVLEQRTSFPFEILVGDDCSEDGTSQILRELAAQHPNLHPVFRQENLGGTRNLYDLQCRARGKYLAYLDGDDFWCDPGKLQRQADFLDAHSDVIACTHRMRVVDGDGRPTRRQRIAWISEKPRYTIGDFHGVMLPGHLDSLIHRNLHWSPGDPAEAVITLDEVIGDRPLMTLLATRGSIVQLPERMAVYRWTRTQHGGATADRYVHNEQRFQDEIRFSLALKETLERRLSRPLDYSDHWAALLLGVLAAGSKFRGEEKEKLVNTLRMLLKETDAKAGLSGWILVMSLCRKFRNRFLSVE